METDHETPEISEVTRRNIVNRRDFVQFHADCYPLIYQTGKTEFDSALPAPYQRFNYAALGLISIALALTVFGIVNCSTPFFKVAVVFSASTLAGRSTIRRIWFEQNSE